MCVYIYIYACSILMQSADICRICNLFVRPFKLLLLLLLRLLLVLYRLYPVYWAWWTHPQFTSFTIESPWIWVAVGRMTMTKIPTWPMLFYFDCNSSYFQCQKYRTIALNLPDSSRFIPIPSNSHGILIQKCCSHSIPIVFPWYFHSVCDFHAMVHLYLAGPLAKSLGEEPHLYGRERAAPETLHRPRGRNTVVVLS